MFYYTLLKINLKRKGKGFTNYAIINCGIKYKAKITYLNPEKCKLLF